MRWSALKPALIFCNILAALTLLVSIFYAGQVKNDPATLHARYWQYGIPAAVSEIGYGLNGYRGYVKVHDVIWERHKEFKNGRLDELIGDLYRIKNVESEGVYFFPADEKGLQDFVSGSFLIFGPKISSFYYFYFLLLSASVACHIICFYNRPAFLAVSVLWLATLYALIPALPLTSEVASLLNTRIFGLLSILASLSLLCLLIDGDPLRPWRIPFFVFQALLVAFVVHTRNAEIWQVLTLVLAGAAALIFAAFKTRSFNRSAVGVLAIAALCFLASQAWATSRFAPEYFGKKLTHKLFWHNVLIGFSVSNYFAKRHGLELNDTSVLLHLAASPEGKGRDDIFYSGTLTLDFVGKNPEITKPSSMSYSGMVRDFAGYEDLARQAALRMMKAAPWETVRLFFFEKPRLFVRNAINAVLPGKFAVSDLKLQDQASALMSDKERIAKRAYIRLPWPIAVLVVMLSAVSFAFGRQWQWLLIASAGMFAFSLLPVMATYPLIHLIWDSLALGMFALLVAISGLAAMVLERLAAVNRSSRA
jgi:hypothetical protein